MGPDLLVSAGSYANLVPGRTIRLPGPWERSIVNARNGHPREGAMKSFVSTILVASLMVAGAQGAWLSHAQAATQARSLPTFEVDKAWPKKPANMKFGDVSSIAIDANDNAWVLTRPRTLKGDDKKMAAPPVTIFDAAGNYVRGWGGDGNGYQWPEREHGILIDSKGFVWLGGNSFPENCWPGLGS